MTQPASPPPARPPRRKWSTWMRNAGQFILLGSDELVIWMLVGVVALILKFTEWCHSYWPLVGLFLVLLGLAIVWERRRRKANR